VIEANLPEKCIEGQRNAPSAAGGGLDAERAVHLAAPEGDGVAEDAAS
jgi:hypothetical protein